MKTEFITIWVDDRPLFVESIKMELEDWLQEKGFDLNVIMHNSADNVLADIRNKDVELIIIDHKMPRKNGDELIKEIRQSGCYQDIIFYSEGGPPEMKFDGVFYVHKKYASGRIKELIELKLKRWLDPVFLRGWIVADSIELELMVTELLSLCFMEKEGFTFADRLLHSSDGPSIEFGGKHTLLNGILKDYIKSLNVRPDKDESVLKKLNEYKKILNDFVKDVIHVRNGIAHQRLEDLESNKVIKIYKGIDIILNDDSFVRIRKNFRKHHKNLTDIKGLIDSS